MLQALFRMCMAAGGWLFGVIVKGRQEKSVDAVLPYRPRSSDQLESVKVDASTRQWLSELKFPEETGKFQIKIHPTELPNLPNRLVSAISAPHWMQSIVDQLKSVEKQIDHISVTLSDDEAGKLQANLEYVIDFSRTFGSTLVLIYLGQIKYERFATVLEQLELQCMQMMITIDRRSLRLANEFQAVVGDPKATLEDLEQALGGYLEARHRWLLGACIRCIAAYLRVSLPRSNRPFVIRQLFRLKRQHRKEAKMDQKILRLAVNAEVLSQQSLRQSSRDLESVEKQLCHHFPAIATQITDVKRLRQVDESMLKNPRKIVAAVKEHAGKPMSLIVAREDNEEGSLKLWKLSDSAA